MPYLKSSQVTGLSPKPLDVTGFTQSASEDLEGTYSQHEVLLADAFNVTDNVTISDNLILAKLSDDGNAITVTGDASTTRTISGSGSLEGSTFAQTPNASLTGMTGTLGSAITNNAGVASGTIATSATFPAGVTIQVQSVQTNTHYSDTIGAGDNYFADNFFRITIVPRQSGSWFKCTCRWAGYMHAPRDAGMNMERNGTQFNAGNTSYANNPMMPCSMGYDTDFPGALLTCIGTTIDKGASAVKGTPITYELVANHEGAGKQMHTNRIKDGGTDEVGSSEFIVEEIAQ